MVLYSLKITVLVVNRIISHKVQNNGVTHIYMNYILHSLISRLFKLKPDKCNLTLKIKIFISEYIESIKLNMRIIKSKKNYTNEDKQIKFALKKKKFGNMCKVSI